MFCPRCNFFVKHDDELCAECNFNLSDLAGYHHVDDDIDTSAGNCVSCDISLDARPIINVTESGYNGYYCYSCAKKIISNLDEKYLKSAKDEFNMLLSSYEEKEKKINNWIDKKKSYEYDSNIKFTIFIIAPISVFISSINESIPAGVMVFILWSMYIFLCRTDFDYEEFNKENRKPLPLPLLPPKIDIKKTNHFCIEHEYNKENKGYREKIINRDNYTCQWCLERKQKSQLEVHHIIPRSKGGNNHPANLVTLCIPCHKKEDWYGHYHKYKNR